MRAVSWYNQRDEEVSFFQLKMETVYYTPKIPGSYSGLDAFHKSAKEQGLNVTRNEVRDWLASQDTYSIHKPVRKSFPRNRIVVTDIDEQWQIDLIDVQNLSQYNDGYRYILTCIDVLSKYSWMIPIKNKKGTEITRAFKKILKEGRKPSKIQSDAGKEFLNREFQDLLKKRGIGYFVSNSEKKASVVERFIRTIKSKMWRYFYARNTFKYLNVLPQLVESYNNTVHSCIRMKPAAVKDENLKTVLHTLYGKMWEKNRPAKFKFAVSDFVRIPVSRAPFRKGYIGNWTEEIFMIMQCIPRIPVAYKIEDLNGDPIEGIFYEPELQKVKPDLAGYFKVENIIQERKRRGKKEYFVKWFGYPESFNSWVSEEEMKKIQ